MVSNSWFKKNYVCKYTWFRMVEGRVADKALTVYVLLLRRMLGRPLDVKVWRGEGGGNFLAEARLKLVGSWRSAGRLEGVRNMLKVSEVNNNLNERADQESLRGK